ncbi:MAG: hypothetical protein KDD55_11400, partial [Bdellovibrionales bacterium]|nr:hypothetical protein [Bdellovibrionales bacterium]
MGSPRTTYVSTPFFLLLAFFLLTTWWFFAQWTRSIRPDDAFIYYSYVKNFYLGNGFIFQTGPAVNACSSALYPLLVGVLSMPFAQKSIPLIGHWIGMGGLLLVILLCLYLSRKHKQHSLALLLFPLVIFSHRLIFAGVAMETFLLLFILLLTTTTYLSGKLGLTSVFSAIAVLIRPDSFVLIGLLALDYLFRERKLPHWKYPLLFFALLAPWYTYHLLTFGEIFPQTLSAKLAQSQAKTTLPGEIFLSRGMGRLRPFEFLPLNVTFLIILLIGFVSARKNRFAFLMTLWGVLYTLSYAFLLNAPGYKWYYTPLLIPLGILLSLGIEHLLSYLASHRLLFRLGVFFIFILFTSYSMLSVVTRKETFGTKWFRYKHVAQWMNVHAESNSSLASAEIGILRYYYERGTIVDILGLVTPEAVPYVRERKIGEFIRKIKPDFILTDKPHRKIREAFVEEAWFERTYESIPKATQGIRG